MQSNIAIISIFWVHKLLEHVLKVKRILNFIAFRLLEREVLSVMFVQTHEYFLGIFTRVFLFIAPIIEKCLKWQI